MMRRTAALFSILLLAVSLLSAQVSVTKVDVVDSAQTSRTRFSSTEKIGFTIDINNTAETSRIYYRFSVISPSGFQVFYHDSNSTPGSVGSGGASILNMPLAFYNGPGDYVFRGEVVVDNTVQDSQTKSFSIYSPAVNLLYPADGVRDIIDNPLIFRWASSGATIYELKVGEDEGMFQTIWTGETSGTSLQYPTTVTDERQKIIGGKVYYWSVTGKDSSGVEVAESNVFSFSKKEEASTEYRRDLGITNITLNNRSQIPENIIVTVEVDNNGSQAENDVAVSLFVDGKSIGQKKLMLVSAGSKTELDFELGRQLKESMTVGAFLNISDDDSRDNLMVKTIGFQLPEEWKGVPKITGRVVDQETKKGIEGIKVMYQGPQSGYVNTGTDGYFKILDLSLGDYTVKVDCGGCGGPKTVTVKIEEVRLYTVSDIEIVVLPEPEVTAGEPEQETRKDEEQVHLQDCTEVTGIYYDRAWEKLGKFYEYTESDQVAMKESILTELNNIISEIVKMNKEEENKAWMYITRYVTRGYWPKTYQVRIREKVKSENHDYYMARIDCRNKLVDIVKTHIGEINNIKPVPVYEEVVKEINNIEVDCKIVIGKYEKIKANIDAFDALSYSEKIAAREMVIEELQKEILQLKKDVQQNSEMMWIQIKYQVKIYTGWFRYRTETRYRKEKSENYDELCLKNSCLNKIIGFTENYITGLGQAKIVSDEEKLGYNPGAAWTELKKYMPSDIAGELEGYGPDTITVEPKVDFAQFFERLKKGEAKIKSTEINIK